MSFLDWVYISQDFAQAEQNFAQSHDCMMVIFRSSTFYEHFIRCLSVIIKVTALIIRAFKVHIDIFRAVIVIDRKGSMRSEAFCFPLKQNNLISLPVRSYAEEILAVSSKMMQ